MDIDNKILDKLEHKIDFLRRKDKDRTEYKKIRDEVFNQATLLTVYKLFTDKIIDKIEFPISTGKEANVFRARTELGGMLAIKIYRVDNATFRNIATYITGDPRFKHIAGRRKYLVEAWASKEYKNLMRLEDVGVRVPKAVAQLDNILVMEYIGKENEPAPIMKGYPIKDPQRTFDTILEYMKKMNEDAELVHGDLSEYNILMNRGKPVVIDVAQAVTLQHPMARQFLERDAANVARFFARLGVKTSKEAILEHIGANKNREERKGNKEEGPINDKGRVDNAGLDESE